MHELDLDSSVPDWLIDRPDLLRLFESLGLDTSCGGKSLRTACQERGLNPEAVLKQCNRADQHG